MSKRLERDADYEWAITKARKKNLEDFRKNPSKPEYLKKMKTFALKNGFPLEEVISEAIKNDFLACMFCKDPQKQSIHEKTAAKFIQDNKHVLKFKKLPASGANALFLHDGKIITKKEHDKLRLTSKSLDFFWEIKSGEETIQFYATHKYTNEGGGAQDHQYNEVISFLNNANQVKQPNVFFLAICDGSYYKDPYKNSTKLQYMKDNFSGKRTEAVSIQELDGLIDRELFKLKLQTPFLPTNISDSSISSEAESASTSKRSVRIK